MIFKKNFKINFKIIFFFFFQYFQNTYYDITHSLTKIYKNLIIQYKISFVQFIYKYIIKNGKV